MEKKIVVDTNGFIKYPFELTNMAMDYQLITTNGVLAEIRDKVTRENVALRFPNLKIMKPEKEAIDFVIKFSLATGDFISLSQVDLELIALSYEIIKRDKQDGLLRQSPEKRKVLRGGEDVNGSNKQQTEKETDTQIANVDDQMEVEQENNANDGLNNHNDKLTETEGSSNKPKEEAKKKHFTSGWGNFQSDDEDGWLGPQNLSKVKVETSSVVKNVENEISCSMITEDFAMQNILLQIGIPLLSIDGKRITKLKSFVLECYSCWAINRQNELLFCKKCGKNTLLKVTCEFLEDGSFVMYKKRNRQPVVRGNRFAIPEPKGGKRVLDLILHEDDFMQPKVQRYLKIQAKKSRKDDDNFQKELDFGGEFNSFGTQKAKMKALKVGYGHSNPNVNKIKKR